MLDDAIDLLSPTKLEKLVAHYLDVERLRSDEAAKPDLLAEIERFKRATLAREYFESFEANSKNYTRKSAGTRAWISECRRLLEKCANDRELPPPNARDALETLFDLLREIDAGRVTLLFFADEGGSWQVGVDWGRVLRTYFVSLSATAGPAEYARRVVATIDHFQVFDFEAHLKSATRLATAEQRQALRAKAAHHRTAVQSGRTR